MLKSFMWKGIQTNVFTFAYYEKLHFFDWEQVQSMILRSLSFIDNTMNLTINNNEPKSKKQS